MLRVFAKYPDLALIAIASIGAALSTLITFGLS